MSLRNIQALVPLVTLITGTPEGLACPGSVGVFEQPAGMGTRPLDTGPRNTRPLDTGPRNTGPLDPLPLESRASDRGESAVPAVGAALLCTGVAVPEGEAQPVATTTAPRAIRAVSSNRT
ncbi:MAG: hypothetical protein ACR2M5_11305 [Nakamurella sp.]